MAETDTAAPAEETFRLVTLNYDGCEWQHKIKMPTEGQTVQILGLMDAKGVAAKGVTPEQARVLQRRAMDAIRLARQLAQGLHEDPEEWRRLQGAMAAGTADDSVMYEVILGAIQAWSSDEPTNRATKRAAAKKARRTA